METFIYLKQKQMKNITNKYKMWNKWDNFTLITLLTCVLSVFLLGNDLEPAMATKTEAYNEEYNHLEKLNLLDCRLTQDEDSHLEKGNGSMYALDIACIRGKSFEVKAPNYKDIYVVKYIGYDKRIGNYVTIKHGDLYFVYGHTKTTLKVGQALKKGNYIGYIDKSGISQNYHLHLELWKGYDNISFKYVEGKGLYKAEKSFKIREQRNWISDKEINGLIVSFMCVPGMEGMTLEAYWDIKHYSIGCGTKSYKGEVITEAEAIKRTRIEIQKIREKYELYYYPINVQVGITSFIYNVGSLTQKQIWLLENHYYRALTNDIKLYNGYYKDGEKIVLKGLEERRLAETALIIKIKQ